MWQKSFQFLISLKLNTAMSMSSVSWHFGETLRHCTVVCYWWQPSKTHLTNILLLLKKCYPIHFFFQKEWSCHFSSYWCKYPTNLAISTKGQCSPKHLCVQYTPEKMIFLALKLSSVFKESCFSQVWKMWTLCPIKTLNLTKEVFQNKNTSTQSH